LPHLEHGFVWCWNLNTSESRSEIPGKCWIVVLEKDGENQLEGSCKIIRSVTQSQGGNILHTIQRKKGNWAGHILVLDDLNTEDTGMWGKALSCTLWRTRFERDYGPVSRQTTEWVRT
jgi:hypothetical protein